MDEADLRSAIVTALRSLDGSAERAIRDELATPFDLGHSGRLQFEVDPVKFAILLTQTERDVVQDGAIFGVLPPELEDTAESAGLDVYAIMINEIVPWFAERWCAAGGPLGYRPAYAFLHGGLDQPRHDLEQRRWCPVGEVWPDAM